MLLRKMRRDMKAHRAQFVSIFLMAFLGVFVYAGIHAEWAGMQRSAERYYAETGFPDFWVLGAGFSAADAGAATALPGVSAAELRLTLDVTAALEGAPVIRVGVLEDNRLSTPYRIKGEPYDPSRDGLWLDESFARAHGLGVGDAITLEAFGFRVKKAILGLVLHPEYVYAIRDDSAFTPDPEAFGFAFTARASLPMAKLLPYTELLVKLDEGADASAVRAGLEALLDGRSGAVLGRDAQTSAAQFQSEIDQNRAMGGLFPVVFFLIAALSMLTTMTRLTGGQRTQIGTLKALGFQRRTILWHYVSYGLWLGLLGGLAGLIAGPAVLPPILFSMQRAIYRLPEWRAGLSASDGLAVVLAVACCGGASFFACRRELGDVPAATLRPRPPKTARHSRLEKSRLWRRLGFSAQWNLRDILRSKVRSAMAVVGVIGCVALLVLALGLSDSVRAVADRLYGSLYAYRTKVILAEGLPQAQLAALTARYPGQLIQESAVEIAFDDRQRTGALTVLAPGQGIRFQDVEGNAVALPESGVALSAKMARLLRVKAGDVLRWRAYGEKEWQEAVVGALYHTPVGQGIAVSEAAYKALGFALKPTALLADGDASDAAGLAGVQSVQARETLKQSFSAILEGMEGIIAILILAAAVLGAVVLYNLGSLSFAERTRELATLKVLGFPQRRIRALLHKQNVWLTLLGIALGLPAGYALLGYMLATISDASDFMPYVSAPTLVVSVGATFLLSTLVSLFMARRIRSIDMVSSLKSVE